MSIWTDTITELRASVRSGRRYLQALLAISALLGAQTTFCEIAFGEDYPDKPITLVIPFSAGGSHDLNARVFTRLIQKYLGQPMVVKLVPGAGGQKGAGTVAESKPDGYTLLFGHNLIDQLQSHVEQLPYDPLIAFRSVWKLNDTVAVIYIHRDSPFQDIGQLISFGLDHPGQLVFPTSGKWGFSFTVGAMLMAETGLRANVVPYKGGGPVKVAILAGDGDFASAPYSSIRSLHQAGRVRVLAVAASDRLGVLPDVPAFGELGLPYTGAIMERIVMAPAATPESRIEVLRQAFRKLYEDDSFLKLMKQMDENINFLDGPDYETLRHKQSEGYKRLVEQLQ